VSLPAWEAADTAASTTTADAKIQRPSALNCPKISSTFQKRGVI